jgi:hypothetical protein
VGERADPGGDGRSGPARRAPRGQRRIARVLGVAVQLVGGEPAQREGGGVGPPEQDRPGPAEIGNHGTVLRGHEVALQAQPVGRRVTLLVGVHLHGHRHARERAEAFPPRPRGVDRVRLRHHVVRAVLDHGVDPAVHGIEPADRILRGLSGRDLAGPNQGRDIGRRQTPELHGWFSRAPRRDQPRLRNVPPGRVAGSCVSLFKIQSRGRFFEHLWIRNIDNGLPRCSANT